MRTDRLIKTSIALALITSLSACSPTNSVVPDAQPDERSTVTIEKSSLGQTPAGEDIDVYTFNNANGVELRVMTLGATLTHFFAPDAKGKLADIVLGYDTPSPYLTNSPYFGATVGRYGNRIANGRFSIDSNEYTLVTNNGQNHLHGGTVGYDKRVWDAEIIDVEGGSAVAFSLVSADGDEGYPGTLTIKAVHMLTDENEFRIDYSATTDKATVLNLTHHSYFNLSGAGDILKHMMMINAKTITAIDATSIPTGELMPVVDTPFDFTTPQAIGKRINGEHPQLKAGAGYDHNFVIDRPEGDTSLIVAAQVSDPSSGRTLEVRTTEPGVQLYTGNFLDGSITGKGGTVYNHRNGFCLETQHYPDSPNHPSFPSAQLNPGETYTHTVIYRTGTDG